MRRYDYYKRGGQGTSERQGLRNSNEQRGNGRVNAGQQVKEGTQTHNREYGNGRNNFRREGSPRHNHSNYQAYSPKFNRIKEDETVEDIKEDIVRIEKEIELELREIRSMKLGL